MSEMSRKTIKSNRMLSDVPCSVYSVPCGWPPLLPPSPPTPPEAPPLPPIAAEFCQAICGAEPLRIPYQRKA